MRYLALLPILALAACSNSSSGGPDRPTAEELASVYQMQEMNNADLPTTGTADFAGEMILGYGPLDEEGEGGTVTGDLDLSVDFAEGNLTGTVSNFVDSDVDVGALNGQLTLADGWLDGTSLGGDMTGSLTGADAGEAFTADVDLNLFGEFVADTPADGPDGVRGGAYGTISIPGAGAAEVEGDFVTIRQD